MQTRKPIVAGQFYPAEKGQCIDEIDECLQKGMGVQNLPDTIAGGIVPHAGWVFSGPAAASVFSAVKKRHDSVDTFIIFGAAHSYSGPAPAVYEAGTWQMPLGEIDIDEELAKKVLDSQTAISDFKAHAYEHSIEVQVPFVQRLFPEAKLLAIVVPPVKQSILLGQAIGDIINREDKKIVCIGSTDLTHYGPRFAFTPMGIGAEAVKWATEVNDKKFIDSTLKLDAEQLLADSVQSQNACGPGAAAATIAAVEKLGKTKGILLQHTNSVEVMQAGMGAADDNSVGYAAIVF